MLRTSFRAAVAATLLSIVSISAASAHAELKTANPGPDETVSGSPTELVATFDQNLDQSRTSLDLRGPDGARVVRGGEIDPAKPRVIRLAVPTLAPGEYEVRWTSFSSEDGELARGRYSFTIEAVPSPSPTPPPASATPPSASATPAASSTPVPTTTPAPEPSATPTPTEPSTPTGDSGGTVLVPILAAVLVAGGGIWFFRRRA